jgi:hypothetical protein
MVGIHRSQFKEGAKSAGLIARHGTSEEVAIEDVALGTAARLFAELKNVSKLRDRRLYV